MLLNGAANRDPRRFDCPAEFRVDQGNVRQHVAFGRGVHSCPGGPLGARRFSYEPTWILRGLTELHLECSPIEDAR